METTEAQIIAEIKKLTDDLQATKGTIIEIEVKLNQFEGMVGNSLTNASQAVEDAKGVAAELKQESQETRQATQIINSRLEALEGEHGRTRDVIKAQDIII